MVDQPLGQAGGQHEFAVGDCDEAVAERIELQLRILVEGRDTGVSCQHEVTLVRKRPTGPLYPDRRYGTRFMNRNPAIFRQFSDGPVGVRETVDKRTGGMET